jgi:uncharacterized protein
MKYSVAPLPAWGELDHEDRIKVARHYRIPVDGTDVLVVPHGRPGWLRFPASIDALLTAIDGTDVGSLVTWSGFAEIADTVRALYDGGLLFIGGRTGVRAVQAPWDSATAEPPRALLLKLTGACDMACSYCYDYDVQRWPGRMSSEIARRLINECLQPGETLTLMFHGGEPMLRFSQICELVDFASIRASEIGATVRFTIQTNGLHFSAPVIDYLRAHRFAVGVSLDGPREIHDRYRIDHRGSGTFERIADNFRRFPDFMRNEVGYISVLASGDDGESLDQTWRFFSEQGVLTWKLLPADAEGRASDKPETPQLRAIFVEFLTERLEAVLAGDLRQPYITNLVQLIEPFLSVERPNMCMKMPCGASNDLLVLDAVGSIRACDCSYHPAFELLPSSTAPTKGARGRSSSGATTTGGPGPVDVLDNGGRLVALSRATTSALVLRTREQWLLHEAPCASCTWLHQCGGTCPARALMNNGSLFSIDDLECSTRLALFPRILADVSLPVSTLRQYYDLAKRRAGTTLAAADGPP